MDSKDPNFFKLNYLCLNKIGAISNQSVIIEKNLKMPDKSTRTKSNKTSISKLPMTPKYNKIDNSKSMLKEKDTSRKKVNWSRAKLNNRKVLNNICMSYYNDNNKINSALECPISLSPSTQQRNYRLNLYNEIMSNTNNYDKKNIKFNTGKNDISGDNISSGNIINNTFIPLTETKYNYLNNNNTYFHTNFVFKIDNNSNFNTKIFKDTNCKISPNKKKNKNIKKLFIVIILVKMIIIVIIILIKILKFIQNQKIERIIMKNKKIKMILKIKIILIIYLIKYVIILFYLTNKIEILISIKL